MTAGRVGKPHGLDGSFYVDGASHPLPVGTQVTVGGRTLEIGRRAGTRRAAPGPPLRASRTRASCAASCSSSDVELEEGEWLADDLLRCSVPGHGRVVRVLDGPSCSVLELEDGLLVPFVSDAIRSVEGGEILIDEAFLG